MQNKTELIERNEAANATIKTLKETKNRLLKAKEIVHATGCKIDLLELDKVVANCDQQIEFHKAAIAKRKKKISYLEKIEALDA